MAEAERARQLRAPVAAAAVLVAAATAVRFATLDAQSLWYDEAVTPERILLPGFGETLDWVIDRENHPPLWYVLAWPLMQLAGDGEVAMRLISAIAITCLVPIGYLIGRELGSRRTGLLLASLLAIQPFLWWYSQEGRPYALYALLAGASFLFLLRARRTWDRRDLIGWAATSSLALVTHYFAAFFVGAAALWLLAAPRRARRRAWTAVAAVAAVQLALLPLLLAAEGTASNAWIGAQPLGDRLWEIAASPISDLTRPDILGILALAAGAGVLAWAFARWPRDLALPVTVAAAAVIGPLAAVAVGSDYLLGRNAIAWLVPALAALSLAVGAVPRIAAVATVALLSAASITTIARQYSEPEHRRDDWRTVAERLTAMDPRPPIVVGGHQAWGGLSYYLGRDEITDDRVTVATLATTALTSERPRWLPPAFRRTSHERLDGGVILDTWAAPRPVTVELPPDELFTQGSFRLTDS